MNYYIFNPDEPGPYKYVHPLKLKNIRNLLAQPMLEYVKYLILFGSSIDLSCSPSSDIDLYFLVDGDDEDETHIAELYSICKKIRQSF